MYVCLCNGFRDSEIRAAARAGSGSPHAAYAALGGGVCCGRCVELAQDVIDEARGEARSAMAAAGAGS